ncbi:RHS repeat domain-containing protein [Leptolyngbya sp. 7M]|uniref:RHS repeat domain-containing protein n=1 Tax=Leptolyngbya sp. 7M TaxID=2812896 RepID=UPI001B8C22BA|nr:RHS repeat protein [Leptolyngbya sp. 7M]QYO66285.1 hypothetical protein JVX88_05655 [Leptolyngbya sp. 7M]
MFSLIMLLILLIQWRNPRVGGEINGVELPSGATIGYAYLMDGRGSAEEPELPDGILRNSPVAKVVQYLNEHDGFGSQTTETWTYSTSPTLSSVYSPDGSLTTTWYQDVQSESWDAGLVYKTVSSNGSMVENIWGRNTPVACGQGNNSCSGKPNNPYIKTSFTSIRNASGDFVLTAIKDFDNDKNGNILEVREYDWVPYSSVPRDQYGRITGIPGDAILKRVTKTEYYNPTPHASSTIYNDPDSYHLSSSKRLLGLVKSVEMLDSSLNPRSRSEMTYDYTDYDSSNTKGGNATLTKVWDSYKGGQYRAYSNPLTSTNSITTSVTYNQYGMPLTTTDANGNVTQFSYGAIQSPNGPVYDLYPTQTVTAYGTNIARTTATQYDFYTGLVTSTMDIDNGVSTVTEYDALGRPTKVRAAANTPLESWTRTEYSDVHRRVVVRSDVEALGDGRKVSIQHYDQLGRVRLARTLEDPQSEDPYNEQHGIKVETRYKTVSGYTYQLTSNPFRANYSTSETDPTMGWTLSTAWSNGRRSEVETFAGAALPVAFGGNNANSTGIVRTDIDANRTLVTDQAGKKRRSITNALGQLIRVDEPDAAGNLGPVSNPVQPTYYSYNTLGKMVRVQQGVQNRYFMYDSLGRLLRVRQPEQTVNTALNTSGNPDNNSWTIGFTYDNNGNLLTSRDANNVVITSTYDALNRQLTRSYSDSTPTVTYTYDDSQVPYSKGRVTKIASSVSETRYTEYDLAGRLEKSEQRTDGAVYPSEYKYNLAGALIEQTYPSGRVVKNVLDANGDISMIQSKRNANFGFHNYAKHFAYTPSGVIQHLQLGNGLWESAVMNSRNQVLELKMGNSPTNGGLMHLTYEYGEFGTDGNVDVTKNAGNIVRQTISFNGLANPFVQRYKYDSLDRITEAKETVNGGQTWIQTFGYDRYGNRTSHSETVQGQAKQINEVTLPAVDAATNRFSNTANYQFDAVGNLIVDAHGRQFVFNGDNKQVQVRDQYNNIVGEYVYDGNAKRIKKITASETVVFVYDGFAKLIGEYSTDGPTQSPMVHYTATDPLGSPRVLTNENGVIISRRDFMPFGEEIAPDTNHRTATHKYGVGDNVRQKFTGYERDEETGLDFAEARYYYNNHGRFTAVDPLLASGKSANPQTFNRYAYTMNRPLILTDPTGLQAGTPVKVEITVPETKVYINEKISDGKKNQYFSGVGAIITIKLTDAEGRPLSGATVSESNVRKAGSGSITENKGAVPLGESGETRDIVGKGEITNTPQTETTEDDVPGVTEFFNSTPFTSTTEQTLTVKTSDGGIYNVITERTITNVGRDGKLNTDLNGNGLNTVVTVSPAKVTVVRAPDPPKSLEPKMLNQ